MAGAPKILYEGKAKQVWEHDSDHFVMHFKNSATAFNAQKKAEIEGKGVLNQRISAKIFQYLAAQGIPTHYVRSLNETDMLVRKVTIVPLEVVIRNIAAGNLCKRLGVEEKQKLDPPLLEFYLKNDALGDPIVTEDHIRVMNLATPADVVAIKALALRINEAMRAYFARVGIILVDFKLEFGRAKDGQLILADEISPDGCRLWDEKTLEIMDKDRFRKDMGGLREAYAEVFKRLENA